MPKASIEQLEVLTRALGELDARRRGIDLRHLDRVEAADLIAAALRELGALRVTANGVQLPTAPSRAPKLTDQAARRREANRAYRVKLKEAMDADPDHPKHGTLTGYTAGSCRRQCCADAMRRHNDAKRAG